MRSTQNAITPTERRRRRSVRSTSLLLAAIALPAMAAASAPAVYVGNYNDSTVSVIDPATNSVTGTFSSGGRSPTAVAVDPPATHVWVTNEPGGPIRVVDVATKVAAATIGTTHDPTVMALARDGRRTYVGGQNRLTILHAPSFTSIATLALSPDVRNVAVRPDGTQVYVAHASAVLTVVDPVTATAVTTLPMGGPAEGLVVSPDGQSIYVGVVDHLVHVDVPTLTILGSTPVGTRPFRIVSTADGARLYVTNLRSASVSVVDTASFLEIVNIPVGPLPGGLVLSPDETRLYVANNCPGFEGGDDTVSVIDTATNTVTTTITGLGSGACAIATSPRCTADAECDDGAPCTADTCAGATASCTHAPLADTDSDGTCDAVDDCPAIANPGQEDDDLDGLGDACDTACTVGALDALTRRCERAAASALRTCTKKVTARARACYLDTTAPCAPGDGKVLTATATLDAKVTKACTNAQLAALCVGQGVTVSGFATRLRTVCLDEPATLAARTFGGPQAAVLAAAPESDRKCLGTALKEEGKLVTSAFTVQSKCVLAAHRGKPCDTTAVGASVTKAETRATTALAAACPTLTTLAGLDAATMASRALAEARCQVATVHPQPGPLVLDCGPRSAVAVPPRGQWVQVVLDPDTSGAQCGDGSSFAFWLRLAPTGAPPERLLVELGAGAPCVSDALCMAAEAAGGLHGGGGAPPVSGIGLTDPTLNPFADWTRVYIPQCSLDLHTGGGVTDIFPHVTVRRFGARNLRAALRQVRDVLWTALDGTGGDGFRPDRLRVFFSGTSGGGYGVTYNYHHLLDDLRWVHTTAVADSALGLDDGIPNFGVQGLWLSMSNAVGPLGWGSLPYLAPYCRHGFCAVLPVQQAAMASRLLGTPEQQMLILSSQVDTVQEQSTAFFSLPSWITALRTAYCANQGKPGLHWFMPGTTTDVHGLIDHSGRLTLVESGGTTPAAWLAGAMTTPAGVVDLVEEGSIAGMNPPVSPFGCPVL